MKSALFAALGSLLLSGVALAAPGGTPPNLIPFQGSLVDSAGAPVHDPALPVVFSIYDASSGGGAALYSEARTLSVVDGLLSTHIGEVVAIPDSVFHAPGPRWLGIQVASSPEMTPRLRIGSAPYSLRAEQANDVEGRHIHPSEVTVGGVPVIDGSGHWIGPSSGLVGPTGPPGDSGFDSSVPGAVTLADADLGIGTSSPRAELHVVSHAELADSDLERRGSVIIAPRDGDASTGKNAGSELLFGQDAGAEDAMVLRYRNDRFTLTREAGGTIDLLTVDPTTRRVGIGTSAPDSALHVVGQFDPARITLTPNQPGRDSSFVLRDQDSSEGFEWRYRGGEERLDLLEWGGSSTPLLSLRSDFGSLGVNSTSANAALVIAPRGGGAQFSTLIRCQDNSGSTVFKVDRQGDATVGTLEITGGMDIVEPFHAKGEVGAGDVVVIDGEREGSLARSSVPYDRCVAGVVSGAGGIQPGVSLSQSGVDAGDTPVALTGRVYVRCNDEGGAIRPGDLLVTSSTPGEAMRATDMQRAMGAVLGKAMGRRDPETGLALVLVNLQ